MLMDNPPLEVMSDMDISGVARSQAPNRTLFLAPPGVEGEIKNAKYALRFKNMLLKQDIEFRMVIVNKCIEWLQVFAPADTDVISWFMNSSLPLSRNVNPSDQWITLYRTICNKQSFQQVASLFEDLMD